MAGWYYNYNMSLLSYIVVAETVEQDGYWPVSLSMYPYFNGTTHEPRFTGVWHWRPGGPHKPERAALIKLEEVPQKLQAWESIGAFPRLVGAFEGTIANVGSTTFVSLVGWPGMETRFRGAASTTRDGCRSQPLRSRHERRTCAYRQHRRRQRNHVRRVEYWAYVLLGRQRIWNRWKSQAGSLVLYGAPCPRTRLPAASIIG